MPDGAISSSNKGGCSDRHSLAPQAAALGDNQQDMFILLGQ